MHDMLTIKICGITSIEDVNLCIISGVHAVGLNFHPQSPRRVSTETAMEIRRALPSSIEVIGVFVRPPFDFLRDVLQRVGLDAVQLYDADAEYLGKLDTGGVPLWLASGIATMDDVRKLKEMVRQCQALRHHVTAVLVDAKVAGQSGGTGQVVPWPLLEQVTWDLPCILAGGLTPENVGNAIRSVRPQGVDVASGVEIAPGKKDETKVRAFVENALTVADEVARESRSK